MTPSQRRIESGEARRTAEATARAYARALAQLLGALRNEDFIKSQDDVELELQDHAQRFREILEAECKKIGVRLNAPIDGKQDELFNL